MGLDLAVRESWLERDGFRQDCIGNPHRCRKAGHRRKRVSVLDVVATRGQVDSALPGGTDWWRTAVIYQVFLRSFADGNGDGVGDLPGLR